MELTRKEGKLTMLNFKQRVRITAELDAMVEFISARNIPAALECYRKIKFALELLDQVECADKTESDQAVLEKWWTVLGYFYRILHTETPWESNS